MADIALTAAQVAPIFPRKADIRDVVLTEAVTRGQVVYQLTTGKFGVADANVAGKQQARGIALKTGAANEVISILVAGYCYGFTVSGLNGDALLYLSDTAGALADSAGTLSVLCGRVTIMTDSGALTKVAAFAFDWLRTWA